MSFFFKMNLRSIIKESDLHPLFGDLLKGEPSQKLEIKLENGLMLNLHHQTEDMLNGIILLMVNYTTGIKLKLK